MGMIFTVIGWLIFGLIVGLVARFLLPGRQSMGLLMTSLMGILGSFVGGTIAHLIFAGPVAEFRPGGWIASILGAFLVVFLYSKLAAR